MEDANLRGAIQAAPESEPRPDQYGTKFEYLRAKLRYAMAKKHGQKKPDDDAESEEVPE